MPAIGEIFQEARLHKGVTLAEAGDATKIHPRYLAALEDGDFESLPEAVYARGFIRNYAAYLGLDGDKLLRLYYGRRSRTRPSRAVVPSKTTPPKITVRFAPSIAAVVFVVVLAAVLLIWSYSTFVVPGAPPTPPAESTVSAQSTAGALGGIAGTSATPGLPIQTSVPGASPAAAAEGQQQAGATGVPAIEGVEIRITAGADAWMLVKIDGQQVFNGTMPLGSYRAFRGGREVAIWTTNAPQLEVEINGTKTGAFGKESVGHKSWVNQNGQIVETAYQD